MATSKDFTVPEELKDITVVDVDAHVSETAKELVPYMDEAAAKAFESGRTIFPSSHGWDVSLRGRLTTAYDKDRASSTLYENYSEILDEFQTDYVFLTPTNSGTVNMFFDVDLANSVAKAYNDFQLNEMLPVDERIRGSILVCFNDPEAAVEEIHRIGDEERLVGIYAATGGQSPPFGDSKYDPIYEAAEEYDLPILFHATAKSSINQFSKQFTDLNTLSAIHTLTHPWEQMLTLVSLMENGVPEKFDLDFVFLEAGIAWVPYFFWRLDKHYLSRRSEWPTLTKKPTDYMDQFYFATQPIGEPERNSDMQKMVELIGPENLMYATDYPHFDYDAPVQPAQTLGLDEEEREMVFGGNAMEVLNIR